MGVGKYEGDLDAAGEVAEDGDEPVPPSRKKLSPIPRKDLDGRSAWIFEQIDVDTSGDLQRAEVVDFFGGASTSMLKKLKPNADGEITIAEWNKFIKGIKKERGESVLEGFLTFCEEIISKKGSGDAAGDDNNAAVLSGILVSPAAAAPMLTTKEIAEKMSSVMDKIQRMATLDCSPDECAEAEQEAVDFAALLRASGHAAEAEDVDDMIATMHQVASAESPPSKQAKLEAPVELKLPVVPRLPV